jgi:SpoVK/Ycf46/Vps4 family AAA+-type ATPase
MMNLDQCLGANRPLIFVVAESDIEVLKHIHDKYRDNELQVYSTTLSGIVPLTDLMSKSFNTKVDRAVSTHESLQSILYRKFDKTNHRFADFIFLDCQSYINDPQNIRDIKDILSRYQLDENFTISMIFITQSVMVPMELQRLAEVVFFDLPDETALKNLVTHPKEGLVKKLELDTKISKEIQEEIINNLKGLTLYEVEQAFLQSFQIHKSIDLSFIRDFKKSAIAKTDLLALLESDITFDQIGGMDKLKEWIRKSAGGWTVEGKKFGLPLLKGVLLVGLPGCGKSLCMKAIGNEWGLPVVSFDPSRIFSSRVGDSEANMRRVLQIVENMSPCILSIDEIEKGLAGMQSSTFSDSGVTARVIGSFLVWLQECTKPVFVIATANAIQYLPPELISRFDETFFVNLPMEQERQDIFSIHIKKLSRDPKDFDLPKLAEKSKDLSGREIEQALREAMYDAYFSKKDLSNDIILNVLTKKTNLLTTMAEQLKFLLKWVGFSDEKNDGIRARFASTPNALDQSRVREQIEAMMKEIEDKKPFSDK